MRMDNFRLVDQVVKPLLKQNGLKPYDIRVSQFQVRYTLDPSGARTDCGKDFMFKAMEECARSIDNALGKEGLKVLTNDSEESPWITIYDSPVGVESGS